MDDARQPATQCEEDVQPEMQAKANLEKHAKRRQDEGEQNANDVQGIFSGLRVFPRRTDWTGYGFSKNSLKTYVPAYRSSVFAMISSWISLLPPKMLWERELK